MPCDHSSTQRIIFWQDIPSHHQSAVIRSLADSFGIDVYWVVESNIPDYRIEMGWDMPPLGKVKLLVNPCAHVVRNLVNSRESVSVHIFSYNRSFQMISQAFGLALKTESMLGIMAETSDPTGVKGILRLALGKMRQWRYGDRINLILAIGNTGRNWFSACGWPADKIFDYGYFPETISDRTNLVGIIEKNFRQSNPDDVVIVFVGRLVKQKGLEILIRALAVLKHMRWQLKIIGDGPARKSIEELVQKMLLEDRVFFVGILPNHLVLHYLQHVDLLILPSRWKEGWGAVVNEALMCGVPVICSDICGAADLLDNRFRGHVFETESITSLRNILSHYISDGRLSVGKRSRIKSWSNCLGGQTVANYLLSVLNFLQKGGIRPVAPWRHRVK